MAILPGTRTLRVVANPFCALDANGAPCGAVQLDPDASNGAERHIGAKRTTRTLVKFGGVDALGRTIADPRGAGLYETTWEFSSEPVTVHDTPYHRQRIACGELFPADRETAAALGVAFVEPSKALASAKAAAATAFAQAHGAPPAWATQTNPAPKPAAASK